MPAGYGFIAKAVPSNNYVHIRLCIWYDKLPGDIMTRQDLAPIKALYRLWHPVYPYLVKQIQEIYGRSDGDILEIGPFCGAIFALQAEGIGYSSSIAAFPEGMAAFFREEAEKIKATGPLRIVESDASLAGVADESADLAVFRGALFFPSLFQVDFSAVYRVLKEKGVALIGGGFGKYTPSAVIEGIAKMSRELNLRAGKIEISEEEVGKLTGPPLPPGSVEVISEGGLWAIVRK